MSQLSGQITVSGVVQFPNIWVAVADVKAHPDNTDTIWIGNNGSDSISSTTGFPLNAGENITVVLEGSLDTLYATADVANEKLCWMILDE
jgi:hypothetical protein